MSLICKVYYNGSEYKTIAPMRKVNYSDKVLFTEYLIYRLNILVDTYKSDIALKFVFTYLIFPGIARDHLTLLTYPKYECKSYSFNNYQLPATMDPTFVVK